MPSLILSAVIILVMNYGNEYFRFKPFGCWAIGHAGTAQLFMPSHGKTRVAEEGEVDEVDEDRDFSIWSYNRAGGLFIPSLVVIGVIFIKDLIYSPFGGILDNLALTLF